MTKKKQLRNISFSCNLLHRFLEDTHAHSNEKRIKMVNNDVLFLLFKMTDGKKV
jgi:hypothetical protein